MRPLWRDYGKASDTLTAQVRQIGVTNPLIGAWRLGGKCVGVQIPRIPLLKVKLNNISLTWGVPVGC